MLYSIIPPIVLVLALIGIIIMLVKKSSQVALIREDAKRSDRERELGQAGLAERFSPAEKEGSPSSFKHKILEVLEGIIRKFRAGVLKLGNVFHLWGEAIRKRRGAKEADKAVLSQNQEGEQEDYLMERIKKYEPEAANKETKRRISIRNDMIPDQEERVFKPMISEKVVTPTPRSEMKDQLEKLLIERIASNPKDVEAYERLGEYYFEIGSYEYAKECFKQIIKLNPGNSNVKSKMRKLERLLMR